MLSYNRHHSRRKHLHPHFQLRHHNPLVPIKKAKKTQQELIDANIAAQKTSEELQLEKEGLKVKETGWWLSRTVVIPPNAYVVHTKRGHKEPITIGLGRSFKYNPRKDSYLVVPAAMQTIGIVVQGISKEKQGISILAYVQWLISDFAIAYKRLDFSDTKDPMGIVNAQLREQAEAAIKDKIATMTVEEILTDKAPIIEELTERMKSVAEGKAKGDEDYLSNMGGLGLQIVTIQIKEAFVSSQRLWEFLQAPYRNERERESRLSRLRIEEEVRQQELTNKKRIETGEAETRAEIEKFQAQKTRESFEILTQESMKKEELENHRKQKLITMAQETKIKQQVSDKELREHSLVSDQKLKLMEMDYSQARSLQENKLEAERELVKLKQEQEHSLERAKVEAELRLKEKEIEIESKLQEMELLENLKIKEHEANLKNLEYQKTIQEKENALLKKANVDEIEMEETKHEHRLAMEGEAFNQKMKQEEERNKQINTQKEKEVEYQKAIQDIQNHISKNDLTNKMIQVLPQIAKEMPEIGELRSVQISPDTAGTSGVAMLASYITKLREVAHAVGVKIPYLEERKDEEK